MRHIPYVPQLGFTDCGTAALTMLFRYYGLKIDLPELNAKLQIGRDGISLYDMREIAAFYGFSCKSYHYYFRQELLDENLPVIVCAKSSHYVIIEKKIRNKYKILDPAEGVYYVEYGEIKEYYKDILVIIRPDLIKKTKEKNVKFCLPIKFKYLLNSILLSLALQLITVSIPAIIQYVVDMICNSLFIEDFVILTAIFIFIGYYLVYVFKELELLLFQKFFYKDVSKMLIDKLFKVDLSFFYSHMSGDLVNRYSGIVGMGKAASNFFSGFILNILMSFISLCIMIYYDPNLTFVIIGVALLQLILIFIYEKRIKFNNKKYVALHSRYMSKLYDVLNGLVQISSCGMTISIIEELDCLNNNLANMNYQKERINSILNSFLRAINLVFPLFLYILYGRMHFNATGSVGELVAFISLAGFFLSPITDIGMAATQFSYFQEMYLRIKEIIIAKERTSRGCKELEKVENIKIDNVSYSYSQNGEKVLRNISMSISKGEQIAIVGRTGSGKSTITKLITGMVNPIQGNVMFNGEGVDYYSEESRAKKVSIVTQLPMMISGSIRKNIDPDGNLSKGEFDKLLQMVLLDKEIKNFPMGIDTEVGENGNNISGGQKQRIAIARALAANPEVIIFDEATSSLDVITESAIYNNINQLNITQIVVTHRLNVIKNFDKIYVISNGKIIEEGTQKQLLDNRKTFYQMVSISGDAL